MVIAWQANLSTPRFVHFAPIRVAYIHRFFNPFVGMQKKMLDLSWSESSPKAAYTYETWSCLFWSYSCDSHHKPSVFWGTPPQDGALILFFPQLGLNSPGDNQWGRVDVVDFDALKWHHTWLIAGSLVFGTEIWGIQAEPWQSSALVFLRWSYSRKGTYSVFGETINLGMIHRPNYDKRHTRQASGLHTCRSDI